MDEKSPASPVATPPAAPTQTTPATVAEVVRFNKVSKSFGEGPSAKVAIQDVSFVIHDLPNRGELIARTPLTPWETYAQALLLSNEAAYVN